MKKKITALLLAMTMVLSLTACGESNNVNTGAAGKGTSSEPTGSITIGDGSGITGDFGYDYGIGMGDVILYKMCHGYDLIATTATGNLEVDKTVVKDMQSVTNDDKSVTVTFTINQGLKWNNGEEIKAKDFVASYLFRSCAAYGETGAYNNIGTNIVGYNEFQSGESKEFTGVRLLGDYEFSATIDKQLCPSYFQNNYVNVFPIYLESWAPGITVSDEGKGAKFSEDVTLAKIETAINAERHKPTVTCGAYNLVSYDESSLSAVFEVNPNYAGNWEGQKPGIKQVIVKAINKDTMLDELRTGSIDVLSGVSSADTINAGLDLVDAGGFTEVSYPSVSLAMLNFACDFGPTQFEAVRQAITYAFDRNEFVKQMTGGYASVSNGYYASGCSPVQELGDKLESSMNQYSYNLDTAKKLLIDDGWTLNKSGGDFAEGTDDVRYKKLDDGTLMPLEINYVGTPTSKFVEVSVQMLADSLPKIGAKFIPDKIDWALMLQHIYHQVDPLYNIFASGNVFNSPVVEPSWDYTIDPALIEAGYNNPRLVDDELYSLAKEMERTESTDREKYLERYIAFQARWNKLLPSMPMYSGTNYDFCNERVQGYAPTAYAFPDYAVLYATVK